MNPALEFRIHATSPRIKAHGMSHVYICIYIICEHNRHVTFIFMKVRNKSENVNQAYLGT
jgi:hypothetical protein